MTSAMRHVIWDWNGTLLDDFTSIVRAVNEALGALGVGPIDAEGYRDHFARPVQRFYENLLGRAIEAETWARLDDAFHLAYRRHAADAPLARDAALALCRVRELGATQSLLSMLREGDLGPAVERHDIGRHMVRIDGLRDGRGDRKGPHLARHIAALCQHLGASERRHWVLVGDSLDDAAAAAENGLACVLYNGGSHHRRQLQAAGVPVADSLVEALTLAGY